VPRSATRNELQGDLGRGGESLGGAGGHAEHVDLVILAV
jgi:hypothetical protein